MWSIFLKVVVIPMSSYGQMWLKLFSWRFGLKEISVFSRQVYSLVWSVWVCSDNSLASWFSLQVFCSILYSWFMFKIECLCFFCIVLMYYGRWICLFVFLFCHCILSIILFSFFFLTIRECSDQLTRTLTNLMGQPTWPYNIISLFSSNLRNLVFFFKKKYPWQIMSWSSGV